MTDKPDGKRWILGFVLLTAIGLVILLALRFRQTALPNGIAVGQQWSTALAVARRFGYEPRDASQLAMDPTPDGFYVELPADRALIVYRQSKTGTVDALDLVDNWSHGKASRIGHPIQHFEFITGHSESTRITNGAKPPRSTQIALNTGARIDELLG